MKTKYDIKQEQLDVIVARDKDCVYCHKIFGGASRKDMGTIEHLNHRPDWYSVQDFNSKGRPVYSIIAICCGSCNSSRGSKPLLLWFQSDYCRKNDITLAKVSKVVQDYIREYEKQ